jgi:hypothetical protein
MPQVPTLNWLSNPELHWLPCDVASDFEPEGYAVQIQVNGSSLAAIVPYRSVRLNEQTLPTKGSVQIVLLADLSDGRYLAELPAAPINGTQRVTVKKEWLKD